MNPQGHQAGRGGHEGKDADVINLGMIAALLLLVIVICLLLCWGILHAFNRERVAKEPPRTRMIETTAKFPQPQLLTQPGNEWRQTRLAAETRLQTYGWVDRQAGVAHIPIAEAMKLLLERGLPEVGAGQTRLQLMQSRPQTNVQPNESVTSPAPEATP
ncbi:MAG TPA: hypothetical protein VH207_14335 [Chthoniobacterales bacterium]|jgi:hypothetical protein|nr:hypothetical protein [Chthoniobacterales bacterium]